MQARRGFPQPPHVPGALWLELGDDFFTLVDAADAPVLAVHIWWRHATNYAATKIAGRQVKLHQLLLPDGPVDHRNRDRLDNRRANLRYANAGQNSANRALFANNTSGYKGVHRLGPGWAARAGINNERRYLGRYKTPEDAARAYDRAMYAAYGEFAVLNFPEDVVPATNTEPAVGFIEGWAKPMRGSR